MTRRLVAASVLVAAAILSLIGLPLGLVFNDAARQRLLTEVERDGRVLGHLIETPVLEENIHAMEEIAERYASRTGGRVVITDLNGLAMVDTAAETAPTRDFSDRAEVLAALSGSQASGISQSTALDGEFGYVGVPVMSGSQVIGVVRVSEPTTEMRERMRLAWIGLAVISITVIFMAGLGGYLIARWVIRPLQDLEEGALQLAAGDLSTRAGVDAGPPELRQLGETFNEMARRLEMLVNSQRAFVADASHELRTPLTALQLRIESIDEQVRDARGVDGEGLERDLDAVAAELERLTGLVEGLLALARAETETTVEVVDAAAAVVAAIERWEPVAEEQGVSLRYSGPRSAAALSVRNAVSHILDNLLDNAITAAPFGTAVEVVLEDHRVGASAVAAGSSGERHSGVVLRVRDHGPGMPPEHLERAANRFWRAPNAAPGGSGLGLAISSQLATLSGGELALSSPRSGSGLVATVRLPHAVMPHALDLR
jgi:signal transduction histidine kinase